MWYVKKLRIVSAVGLTLAVVLQTTCVAVLGETAETETNPLNIEGQLQQVSTKTGDVRLKINKEWYRIDELKLLTICGKEKEIEDMAALAQFIGWKVLLPYSTEGRLQEINMLCD